VTKVLTARVPDELADWAEGYARERGVTRQALIEEAVRSLKEDAEGGVPDIRDRASRQVATPSGECPKNAEGHVWASPREDPERPCVFCGLRGRLTRPVGQATEERPNGLDEATKDRTEFFSGLQVPMQSGTGDPRKAWPNGMPPAMAARAARIVEEKRARDAEARKAGKS
jgi:hypothetical protein